MAESDPAFSRERSIGASELAAKQTSVKSPWRKRALMFSVPLAILAVAAYAYSTSGQTVSTDNAYVKLDIVSVSSDVGGRIVSVQVQENQQVKKGDVLFVVDRDPFEVAMRQANAQLASAQVQVQTLETDLAATSVDIEGAREDVAFAQQDLARQRKLMADGFTTRARIEESEHDLAQARETLNTALADAAKARAALATGAQVPGVNPAIASASAQRAKAALDLSRTVVRAPVSGRISQSSRLQVGQMMITGLPAVSIVANEKAWVEANFKETDLGGIRAGQPVEVELDAYPGVALKGHVESIGAGTGSQFSVLPAQNATGNWVKVTQRVPVRIAIDERSPRPLIAGLSADVSVRVDGKQR